MGGTKSSKLFDPLQLQDLLDGPHRASRERLRKILSHPRFRHEYGISTHAFRERVYGWCKELALEGVSGMPYPTAFGGEGNPGGFLAAAEEIASFDVSLLIKFGVHVGLFGGSIYNLGSQRHHEEYLPKVIKLELPGCFAMTETGHGSNVRELQTTATYEPETEEFVIHTPDRGARKDYIGNAALHAQMATVFAQLIIDGEHFGVHAFLVPIRNQQNHPMPGVEFEDDGEKIGLNGVDNGRIQFTQVRIPRRNLLDRFAQVDANGRYSSPISDPGKRFFTMLSTLVMGRVSLAAAANAVTRVGLTIAIRYGSGRRQFGEEGSCILDFQAHQRQLMPRLANVFATTFATQDLVASYLAEPDSRELEGRAAGLKAWASWNNIDTLQVCREACGGQGYLAVNRIGQLKADTDVFATFEGANPVLLQLVAKGLLTEFREQFASPKWIDMVKYLTQRAAAVISEQNPIIKRNTDAEHLRDSDFQLNAFRFREESLLLSAARRLKKKIEAGMSGFDAFNACQDHLITLALAHVERLLLESFVERVEQVQDSSLRAVLKNLCDLFALSRIERDRGWFLEAGYFEGVKSKAIRSQVIALCAEVREVALPLVDAFGIPEKFISAPIAQKS